MKISTVTIARNGAALLPRMLASVAGADEHVVLVNGCSDDTEDVAQRHGCRVFETDTADDFAALRNEAKGHATGDWLLSIDCDQELLTPMTEVREQAKRLDAQSVKVGLVWTENSHWREVFFRNDPEVRWMGKVHEYVIPWTSTQTSLVRRRGVDPAAKSDPERNLRLLLASDPTAARTQFYLGRELWERARYAEAEPWLRRFLDQQTGSTGERADAWLRLAQCQWQLQRGGEARESCIRAIAINPHFREAIGQMSAMQWPSNRAPWDAMAETANNNGVLFVR
jgi:tetratricopeptide (TPR) repeat protein